MIPVILILLAALAVGYWHVVALTWLLVLAGLLAVGQPLFWLLCLAETGIILWAIDDDDDEAGIVATFSLVIFAVILQASGSVHIVGFLRAHPWQVLAGLAGYLAIGAAWSVVKS